MFLKKCLKLVKSAIDFTTEIVLDIYKKWIQLEHFHEKGLEVLQELAETGDADYFYINQIFMEPKEKYLSTYDRLKPKIFILGKVHENVISKEIDKIIDKYTVKAGNPNGIFAKATIKYRPLVLHVKRNYTTDKFDEKTWGEWRIRQCAS